MRSESRIAINKWIPKQTLDLPQSVHGKHYLQQVVDWGGMEEANGHKPLI